MSQGPGRDAFPLIAAKRRMQLTMEIRMYIEDELGDLHCQLILHGGLTGIVLELIRSEVDSTKFGEHFRESPNW